MKFTTLVTSLALAGAGLSTPSTGSSPHARIGRRDAATINAVLTEVVEKMTLLDAAVLKYQGGSDLTDIAETAYFTVEAIRGASMRVANTSAAASVAEATEFAPAVERLTIAGEGLLSHVVAQTVNFTTSGMCSDTYPLFNDIGQGVTKLMADVAAKSHADARYPAASTIQRITDLFASTNAGLQACAAAVPRPSGAQISLGPLGADAPPTVTGTAVLPPAGPGAPTPAPAPAAATPDAASGTNGAAAAGATTGSRASSAAAPSLGGIARSGAVAVLAAACLLL